MNSTATEWLDDIGDRDDADSLDRPSEVPLYLTEPIVRSPSRAVRLVVAEFLRGELSRREREQREKFRAWSILAIKLLLAWSVVVFLLWFQVRNLESMLEVFHDSSPPWLRRLSMLRDWMIIWGPAIPILGFVVGYRLFRRRDENPFRWSNEDVAVLGESLRGTETVSDVETTAREILNVDEGKSIVPKSSKRSSAIRVMGRRLSIENARELRYHRAVVGWPRLLSITASAGLLTVYLGLTLLPLIWMLEAYLHRSVIQ